MHVGVTTVWATSVKATSVLAVALSKIKSGPGQKNHVIDSSGLLMLSVLIARMDTATITAEFLAPVASPQAGIEALREAIQAGLARHETLSREVSAGLVAIVENSVQIGRAFENARSLFPRSGGWIGWVEGSFALTVTRVNQLRRLARCFNSESDLIDQILKLGISSQNSVTVSGVLPGGP